MARLGEITELRSIQPSEALEWFVGDATSLSGVIMTDTDPAVPQNLTGASLTAKAEFYKATVQTSSRTGSLSLSSVVRDSTRPTKTLAVSVSDQAVSPGHFTLIIPADLYPGEQPEVDLTQEVPIAVCYLTKTQGNETRTVRFVVVFRRGQPV